MTKSICTVWDTYLRYSKLYGVMWKREMMTSNITGGSSLSLSSPEGVRTFWLLTTKHPCRVPVLEKDPGCIMCVPPAQRLRRKDPLLHLHRLAANTQGSLPLHLAASKPQELLCCCPNHLKAAGQWPAGPHERGFLTAAISYWICAWATPGDVAAEDSRTNIFFRV